MPIISGCLRLLHSSVYIYIFSLFLFYKLTDIPFINMYTHLNKIEMYQFHSSVVSIVANFVKST